VPKKYLTEIGDDGFKKHPIGAGPYKFVSNKPGIEVELEAYPGYWRRVPNVKTLVMRSVPDATTRALMVKTGEADMAYALDGVDAEGLKGDPGIQIVATKHASIFWIEFTEQWDPKSPWHDKRLRLAVNYALARHPRRSLHPIKGRLRLRRLSRHRRIVPPAGRRARPRQARGAPLPDPAIDDRPRHVRAGDGSARADGRRPAHHQTHDHRCVDEPLPILRGHGDQGVRSRPGGTPAIDR